VPVDDEPVDDEQVARVLLADDSAVNQLVASLELERLGYRVDVVTTGEEAIDAVGQTRYHAVLMDCLMPGIDGYEATRRIRRLEGPGRATPIIAMTASAMLGDHEECILAGMDGYLSKPLDSKLLAAALTRTREQIAV
jgi:CheY-like chemotaxis protein